MPIEFARRLAERQHWLITAVQAAGCGMTLADIKEELRRGRWMAVARGVYLIDPDMYADGLPRDMWWRTALLSEGEASCLVASTAVRAAGVEGLPIEEPFIELGLIGGFSRHHQETRTPGCGLIESGPQIRMRQLVVDPAEVTVVDGMRVRRADLSVVDTALNADRATGLAILDSCLFRNVVTEEDLAAAISAAAGRRGVVQLRELGRLVDGRAQSAGESRVRLACIDQRVAPDDLQHVIHDDAHNVVAIGDLAWFKGRRRTLLGEVDGKSVHSQPEAVYRDRGRGNLVTGEACDTIRFTYGDSFRPQLIGYVVRRALAANA